MMALELTVKTAWQSGANRWGFLLCLMTMLGAGRVCAAVAADQPVITSLSVANTNLIFDALFPAGVEQAILEMRPTLADAWSPAASIEVPATGGLVEFSIPKPALEMAFFRLNVAMPATTNAPAQNEYSTDLQYVAVPPLGPDSTNTSEAVFHFKGMIDGSDRILINHQGALWEHVNWSWPDGAVTVNGSKWNPAQKNFMTATGAVSFLPEQYDLRSPRLERIIGRDVVVMERTNDALIVYLNDTPSGGAPYEFKIHFPLIGPVSQSVQPSIPARLKIAALIDGSDLLKITTNEAVWTHGAYRSPTVVRLNGISWNLRQTNVLSNAGTNIFLPAGVDLSTAKIVSRQGRDLATMWADHDAVWVQFADNPNGADTYELDLSFGQ